MKVVIYRNRYDKDIKKISRFVNGLQQKVNDTVDIEVINDISKDRTFQALCKGDILIIFSHGEDDKILYRLSERSSLQDYNNNVLIDYSNIGMLANKKAIVFACYTAKNLGDYAVRTAGLNTYIGFEDSIDYTISDSRVEFGIISNFFYIAYSEVFEELIVTAINRNLTPKKIQEFFSEKMTKRIIEYNPDTLNEQYKLDGRHLLKIVNVLSKTLKGFRAKGNIDEGLVS